MRRREEKRGEARCGGWLYCVCESDASRRLDRQSGEWLSFALSASGLAAIERLGYNLISIIIVVVVIFTAYLFIPGLN